MSILLIIKKLSPDGKLDEWLVMGSVEFEAASDWIDEIFAAATVIERLDSAPASFYSNVLLPPAGTKLQRFEPTNLPSSGYEYKFMSEDLNVLEQLIDKFSVVQGRSDLASTS